MSKYVKGIKRNQIIQRWLQGIEDQDYEVFPTKKDGKYIVKLRENKAPVKSGNPPLEVAQSNINITENNDADNDNNNNDNEAKLSHTGDESEPKDVELSRRRIAGAQRITTRPSKMKQIQAVSSPVNNDSTINLEILEQLRSLGEEIRNDRFKKEQKQYIKHVVNKELNKSRIRSKYVPDILPTEEADADVQNNIKKSVTRQTTEQDCQNNINNESEHATQIEIEQPKFRSRIRR